MYVRFVSAAPSENAYLADGLFTAAGWLRDHDCLEEYEIELVDETFEWFNENLPCPPFKKKLSTKAWTEHAVAWFRDNAQDFIHRMWDFVTLLKEHGEPVRFIAMKYPGHVLYSDDFQIVAERPRRWVKNVGGFRLDTNRWL